MFYVIDLSKPRKYIQEQYNNIMLDYKLSPPKVNKTVIAVAVIGIVILAGATVNASGAIDQTQYNYLVEHFTKDLHYPKELAEKTLNKLSVTDFQELYSRVQHHNNFMDNGGGQLLEAGNKITSKAVGAIKAILNLYSGM